MKKFLLLIVISLSGALMLSGQDVDRKNAQKEKIEKEISFIDKQLKGLSSKQKKTTQHLALIRKKVSNRKAMIQDLDREIVRLDSGIDAKTEEIAALERQRDTLKAYFARLIYNSYKNRSTKVWFMYILGSENVGQGYRRLHYLKDLSEAVNRQVARINDIQAAISDEQAVLESRRQEVAKIKGTREKEYTKLLDEEKESKIIIAGIARDKKAYQKQLATKKKQVARLNSEIERILKADISKEKTKKRPSVAETALSGKFEQNKGRIPWPVRQGVITEHFGVNFHPVYKNLKLPDNNGITISTVKYAEVLCVFEGTVKQVIMMPGYGHCVLVRHGEYYTFYCKMREVTVKSGQAVKAGQILGSLEEDNGTSQVHFQIWKGTTKQNPEKWLAK